MSIALVVTIIATFNVLIGGAIESDFENNANETFFDLRMPGFAPKTDEQYVCVAFEVLEPGYIVEFLPTATADRVHHMLLYGCDDPVMIPGDVQGCEHHAICNSRMKVLYAWARNAPPFKLPENVGVPIGRDRQVGYVILQMHYSKKFDGAVFDYSGVTLRMVSQQPQYIAGIHLFATGGPPIPPNTKSFSMNTSCIYTGKAAVHPFAYRTHAHSLGRIITAYKYDKDHKWTKIGKGNPQWPQRFYSVEHPLTIVKGDTLAAQCIYDSSGRDTVTAIGAHGENEMCNFYMYYYVDSNPKDVLLSDGECEFASDDIFSIYPAEASVPFPRDANLEETAKQMEKRFGNNLKLNEMVLFGRKRRAFGNEYASADANVFVGDLLGRSSIGFNNPDGFGDSPDYVINGGSKLPVRQQYPAVSGFGSVKVEDGWRYNGKQAPINNKYLNNIESRPPVATPAPAVRFGITESTNWPASDVKMGQIAGLTVDKDGNIIVFHRGDHVWNDMTFDVSNRYRQRTSGPIMDETVVTIGANGKVVSRWGRGLFYMPHGVWLDKDGFLYITDVALHQVLKFDMKRKDMKPLITLGVEFEPGNDYAHFCQPSAVAVAGDGTIFVADGYCNNRIMKFTAGGAFAGTWGEASMDVLHNGYAKLGTFTLPHSLSLNEAEKQLFVADRENGRVQIFTYNGTSLGQIVDAGFDGAVYGISYCESLDIVFALNGLTAKSDKNDFRVFAVDASTRKMMYSWKPRSGAFLKPHALVSSADCSKVFVGETEVNKLWRFDINATGRRAMKKDDIALNVSPRKPGMSIDAGESQNLFQMMTVLVVAIIVPLLLIAAICVCIRLKKRGGFRAMNMARSYNGNRRHKDGGLPLLNGTFSRSHKGFQPLSTEDIDAMDDLTDDSETEDTLYPVNQKKSAPRNA